MAPPGAPAAARDDPAEPLLQALAHHRAPQQRPQGAAAAAAAGRDRASVVALASGMLLAGTINTLLTKYADLQVVGHDPDSGAPILFSHPAFQTALMFGGELMCLLPWLFFRARRRAAKRRRDPSYAPGLDAAGRRALGARRAAAFALPALCDAAASTAMNAGLALTSASVYQMLRGTLVLWTGAFTVVVLRRRLRAHHWLGMALIAAGAALVGVASVLASARGGGGGSGGGAGRPGARGFGQVAEEEDSVRRRGPHPSAPAPLLGDLLVVAAQAGTALQFVLEEAFLRRYRVPALLAVGLEGAWGSLLSVGVLLPLANAYRPAGPGTPPVDDLAAAVREVAANPRLAAASLLSVFSVAAFNFCGIGVTKRLSGASRATIDATRTLFVWLFAVWRGWERVVALQLLGFVVLVAGSSLYNEILRPCLPKELMEGAAAAAEAAAAAGAAAAERGDGAAGGAVRYRRLEPDAAWHGMMRPGSAGAVYGGGEVGVAVYGAEEEEEDDDEGGGGDKGGDFGGGRGGGGGGGIGGRRGSTGTGGALLGGQGDVDDDDDDEEVVLVVSDGQHGASPAAAESAAASASAAMRSSSGGGGGGTGAVPVPAAAGARALLPPRSRGRAVAVDVPAAAGSVEPWGGYALARSMRLGVGALSPRSLVPSGGSALALGAGGRAGGVGVAAGSGSAGPGPGGAGLLLLGSQGAGGLLALAPGQFAGDSGGEEEEGGDGSGGTKPRRSSSSSSGSGSSASSLGAASSASIGVMGPPGYLTTGGGGGGGTAGGGGGGAGGTGAGGGGG